MPPKTDTGRFNKMTSGDGRKSGKKRFYSGRIDGWTQ